MEIFEKSNAKLGQLDKDIVGHITVFYTCLKASRDATESFRFWSHYNQNRFHNPLIDNPLIDLSQRQSQVISTLITLQLAFQDAFLAIDKLAANDLPRDNQLELVKVLIANCAEKIRDHIKSSPFPDPDYLSRVALTPFEKVNGKYPIRERKDI
jgi:hypothetical protein